MHNEIEKAWKDAIAAHNAGNDREAERVLIEAHQFLNSMSRDGWGNSRKAVCVCGEAAFLAKVASVIDLAEFSSRIVHSTFCARFDGPYRPTPIPAHFLEVSESFRRHLLLLE